jgi:hypothetical protein
VSHFLFKAKVWRPVERVGRRAAVRVRVVRRRPPTIELDPDPECPVCIIGETEVTPLPENVVILDGAGGTLGPDSATGRYYVTTETFDPYHLLLDVF